MTIRDKITGGPTEVDPEPPDDAIVTVDNPDQREAVEEEAKQVMDDEERDIAENTDAWIQLLQADTPKDQVHHRQATARGGQPVMVNGQALMLDYVTARFVQDRLDAAVGPANWQTIFESLPSGAVRCGIGIRPPGEGEWITKWDVGVPSNIEPDKGAHSDAFKRAAVQWGIARDLYDDRDEKALNTPAPQMAVQPAPQQVAVGADGQPPAGIQYTTGGQPIQPTGVQPVTTAWLCPIHEQAKIVPAGVSKRTGRQYRAFYACDVPGCDQKGPSV